MVLKPIQELLFKASFVALSLMLWSCVNYKQGDYSKPENHKNQENSIPKMDFRTRAILINPPVIAKIGDSKDTPHQSCAQFGKVLWKPKNTKINIQPKKGYPRDLQNEFEKSISNSDDNQKPNQKTRARIKLSKNEFILQKDDLTLYKNNPDPLEVIESLNLFSPEILPRKISGEMNLGQTPSMLLRYAKTLNDDVNYKITSVTSLSKIPGGFFGENLQAVRDNSCKAHLVSGIHYGAALSIALSFKFVKIEDRLQFEKEFGPDLAFSASSNDVKDEKMSIRLKAMNVSIEMNVAQIGGDIEKTKQLLPQLSCHIENLESCREARRKLIEFFFNVELSPPVSPDQANGWMPVNLESLSLGN